MASMGAVIHTIDRCHTAAIVFCSFTENAVLAPSAISEVV